MKNHKSILRTFLALSVLLIQAGVVRASTDTWTGGGGNSDTFWNSPTAPADINWNSGLPQAGGDLIFPGTVGLVNSNNYADAFTFNSITFATPSGAFDLKGNRVTLTGGITNNQPVTVETIEFPIILSGSVNVDVTANGALTLTNTISGSGSLSKSGGGTLTLNGKNTFAGPLTVNGGTVAVNAVTNLPAPPAVFTPGNVVLNSGTLQTLATFGFDTNRGIALGPTSGSGSGAFNVNLSTTLTNGDIMADNGGVGGLTKLGAGTMILSGANTYSGPTTNLFGQLTLDFTKPTSPGNNVINSSSSLTLGGTLATYGGAGQINPTALFVNGTNGANNSQTFSDTLIDVGGQVMNGTNNGAGSVSVVLNVLSHNTGGAVTFVASGPGSANFTTTSPNVNGILGGWATIGDGQVGGSGSSILRGTNFACVDIGGNITNFNNYYIYNNISQGTLHSLIDANTTGVETNLLINPASGVIIVPVDNNGAGTTTDVNAIKLLLGNNASAINIGTNNTLRLGRFGGILKVGDDAPTITVGTNVNQGTLTAGGPNNNTAGEIVMNANSSSENSGAVNINSILADNGSGSVALIKMGSGGEALVGHGAYSGGTYVLQGRLQLSGDSFGSGPIYVLPGGQIYFSVPNLIITNNFFVSGNGFTKENDGGLRFGNTNSVISGTITLLGDTSIGSSSSSGSQFWGYTTVSGQITGPYGLIIGAAGSTDGGIVLVNTNNNWHGNTTIRNSGNATSVGGVPTWNYLQNGASEVIPNGFGYGNVFMDGSSVATAGRFAAWDLNGFNETINGLSTINANPSLCTISNSAATPSTLIVGDNDQGGVFGGIISVGPGILNLTKIGGGVETLTNANTYTGNTTISNGVLQLTGNGLINSSANIYIDGGTFDVSALLSYTIPSGQTININGGAFYILNASGSGAPVNMTNGILRVGSLNSVSLTVPTIDIGGATNVIQPASIPSIPVYPATFPVMHYTGALNGNTATFGASLPAGYVGSVSVDTVNKLVNIVLTSGPITPLLTWYGFSSGALNSTWDFIANDWTNKPAHSSASYSDGSLVTFDDSGLTNVVNLNAQDVFPAGVTFANTNVNYTLVGSFGIRGTNGVTKLGSGKLTLDNTGVNDFSGGLSIGGGIVQVGINDAGGGLGNGTVGNNGTIVFNRNNSTLTVPNVISGSGGLLVSNTANGKLILSGNSSYGGDVYVVPGVTLAAANNGALGVTNGTATIPTGATLDVSGSGIAANSLSLGRMVSVSGAGVDSSSGAIVNNTTTNQQNALLRVTLTGNATFGGTGRWDIRGTPTAAGALSTGGNIYNLTKVGSCFLSIANVNVDSALSNVDVQAGTLEVNGATTGLGSSGTLTIENGATLQIFNMTNTALNKQIILNGNGSVPTLTNASGNNVIVGPMMLSNSVVITVNADSLTLNNAINGSGSLTKNGTSTLTLSGAGDTYSGATTVNDGTLLINGVNSGSTLTENVSATTPVNVSLVGGNGTNAAPVDIEDTLWPGVAGKPATFGAGDGVNSYNGGDGSLVLGDVGGGVPKAKFSLNTSTTAGGGVNDLVTVNGDLNGNFAHVVINPLSPLTVGSPYTLITYTGSKLNNFSGLVGIVDALQPSRYTFSLDYGTAGQVKLNVLTGSANLVWNNAASTGLWTTNTADANWLNTGTSANDQFYQQDSVTFNDSIGAGVTSINIATTNLIPGTVTVSNTAVNYTLTGAGSIGGSANLVKQGASTLIINNANTFNGTVTILGGTIQVTNALALGSTNGITFVTNNGTLDANGFNLGGEIVSIAGTGVGNAGAVVNTGAKQTQMLQFLTLATNASIGGTGPVGGAVGRWDLRGGVLSTGGHAYNLTKVGNNEIGLVDDTVDPALGNIDVQAGDLHIEGNTTSLGDPTKTLTAEPGAALAIYGATNLLNKQFLLIGDGVSASVTNLTGANTMIGPMTLSNACTIYVGGTALTNSGIIGGSGSLKKDGAGMFVLTTNTTYTGNTTVSAGTMSLLGNGAIGNSSNIILQSGTTLDVGNRVNNTLTLNSSQTLAGNGTVNGTLTAPSSSIVTVGTNGAVSKLTVTTNANLSGTLNMKLNKSGATNDVLAVGGQVNYGGVLSLNNLSGTLAANDSFKLFNAGTYGGTSFASITPAHPNNDTSLNWDTSLLTVSGTLKVVSAGPPPQAHITNISLSGTTLSISATNGSPGGVWTLLQTTNVALPLAQWDTNRTVTFDGSGNLSTNVVNVATNAQEFYILKQ